MSGLIAAECPLFPGAGRANGSRATLASGSPAPLREVATCERGMFETGPGDLIWNLELASGANLNGASLMGM